MKTLCITGFAHPALDTIAQLFFDSGLAPASASKRDGAMDLVTWHQRVLARHSHVQSHAVSEPPSLGRLWEQLATDVFMANIDTPAWGWCNPNSVSLLDFWHQFDPHIQFVLVCLSPRDALAHAIANPTDPAEPDVVLSQWHDAHQTMLRFHLRHPDRSILVTTDDALTHPEQLIHALAEKWALPLQIDPSIPMPSVFSDVADPVARYLAGDLLQRHAAAEALHQEVLASVTSLSRGTMPADIPPAISAVIATYQQLCDRTKEAEALQLVQAELTTTRDTLKANLDALTKAHDAVQADLQNQLQSAKVTANELTATAKARDEQVKLAAERKTQLDQLTKEKAELTKQRDALKGELAAAIQTRDTLKADLQKQQTAVKASAAELTETREEAELLLLQLHQVQEELEHYFLEHRAAQQLADTCETRWQRMLQRNPEYCDFESLRCTPSPTGDALQWQIDGLETAGRSLPTLHCETLLHNGRAAFRFTRPAGEVGPLLHWPTASADASETVIYPEADNPALAELATSDLTLLQNLAARLCQALDNPAVLTLPGDFKANPLQQALRQLPQQLVALTPALHFDHIRLVDNQTHPGYEHLWIALDNISLGTQRWPQFEFRLACANVGASFGSDPRLEFPQQTGQAPLPGWFIESDDAHGNKLELRFALPEAMDIQVWNQLGDADHHFLRALIEALPRLLTTLQASGAQISRAWQDWFKLADDSRRILALRAPVENAADAPLQ